jgi:hypothetical protein
VRGTIGGPVKAPLDGALVDPMWEVSNGHYALGSPRFQVEIEQALGRRATKGKAGRPKAQPQHRRGRSIYFEIVVCLLLFAAVEISAGEDGKERVITEVLRGHLLRNNQADNLPAPLAIDGKVTI